MAAVRAKVMRWCRKRTSDYPEVKITNFTDSWTDGRAFSALMHELRPDFFSYENLDHEEVYENLRDALDTAQQAFNISNTIQVEDVMDGNGEIIFELLQKIYNYSGGRRYLEMLGADSEPEEENALFSKYQCCICFEEHRVDHGIVCSVSGFEKNKNLNTEVHQICAECLVGQARALCSDGLLAPFGAGIRCPQPECKNVLQWGHVTDMLPADLQKRLGNRVYEEVVMVVNETVERCKSCPFVAEFEVPVDTDPIFDCIECGARFCRRCKADWEGHKDLTCEELAGGDDFINARKELENDLTNAITRKCHRCSLIFAKEGGCNRMKCRCGATQCYCCRETDIDYGHFGDECKLYANKDDVDKAAVQQVKENAERDPLKKQHMKKF